MIGATAPEGPGGPALERRVEVALEDACCEWEESGGGYLHCLCTRPAPATLDLLTGLELARRWKRSPDAGSLLGTLTEHLERHTPIPSGTPRRRPDSTLPSPRRAQPGVEESF
ncbi:hypothetical protein [Nocardioides iriomotensis]|uniref:Uncharacterized protein n=1 Tax=Nocardioides iriomotensis TaxID=715784 RepID=A0A4Q5J8P2_9ACTN|nr:hypothetical protein [Nocardioides iriomotensis]RYU15107.1 hypothetical protein ETU37_01885 [Nocardioides iriomotensis]